MQHSNTACCILLKFYIKPQHSDTYVFGYSRCILSKFYIKPQRCRERLPQPPSCILSKFHIKPQPRDFARAACWVVSYRNSTSNHNESVIKDGKFEVVSYRNSTSNHNPFLCSTIHSLLYLIEIPHQTTTAATKPTWVKVLYLIEIPHQTTTPFRMLLNQ